MGPSRDCGALPKRSGGAVRAGVVRIAVNDGGLAGRGVHYEATGTGGKTQGWENKAGKRRTRSVGGYPGVYPIEGDLRGGKGVLGGG